MSQWHALYENQSYHSYVKVLIARMQHSRPATSLLFTSVYKNNYRNKLQLCWDEKQAVWHTFANNTQPNIHQRTQQPTRKTQLSSFTIFPTRVCSLYLHVNTNRSFCDGLPAEINRLTKQWIRTFSLLILLLLLLLLLSSSTETHFVSELPRQKRSPIGQSTWTISPACW